VEEQGSRTPRYSDDGRWWWDGQRWLPVASGPPGILAPAVRSLPWIALGLGVASIASAATGWSFGFLFGSGGNGLVFAVIVLGFVLAPLLGVLAAALGIASRRHSAGIVGCVCGAAGLVVAAVFWIYLVIP